MFITYDYRCLECGHKEPLFVKKDEKDKQACLKCGGGMLRLPAAPSTTFKFNDK